MNHSSLSFFSGIVLTLIVVAVTQGWLGATLMTVLKVGAIIVLFHILRYCVRFCRRRQDRCNGWNGCGRTSAGHTRSDSDGKSKVFGDARYTNTTLDSLSVFGELVCSALTVREDVSVYGDAVAASLTCRDLSVKGELTGSDISCNNLSIMGALTVQRLNATGDCSVFGSCALSESTINDLSLSGQATLDSTVTGTIVVRNNAFFTWWMSLHRQKIVLSGTTVVNGDIVFERAGGIVEISGAARISGEVRNGKIVQK